MNRKSTNHDQPPLVFATDPGNSRGITHIDEAIQQLEHYLSTALKIAVRVIVSENYEEILARLGSGDIDVAKLGPYAFALAQARYGARALVTLQDQDGAGGETHRPPPYRSVIVTRADSGITHLSQLNGQTVGFVDRNSTTGYLVATFLFQQASVDVEKDLKPVFLFSHRSVAEAILSGEVVAGAMMEGEFARSSAQTPALRLLAASPLLARGPIVVRPDLSPQLERNLQAALLALQKENPEYVQLLKSPAQRFVPAVPRERTLKTVAELAGVSYATVSRAINGRDRIAPETAARILQLVKELGYRPNANALSLHKSRGDLVALLLPSLHYPELDAIVHGVQETLDQVAMRLLVCPVGEGGAEGRPPRQEAYFEMLANSRFEGALLTQWSAVDAGALELVRAGHPFVLLEQDILDTGLSVAWRWFREQGYERIGLVVGERSVLEPTLTQRACSQSRETRFQFFNLSSSPDDWIRVQVQQASLPDAILCTDSLTALSIREALSDLAAPPFVMGIGDSELARWTKLPILTFDGMQVGRAVAQRLLKMLNRVPASSAQAEIHFWVQSASGEKLD